MPASGRPIRAVVAARSRSNRKGSWTNPETESDGPSRHCRAPLVPAASGARLSIVPLDRYWPTENPIAISRKISVGWRPRVNRFGSDRGIARFRPMRVLGASAIACCTGRPQELVRARELAVEGACSIELAPGQILPFPLLPPCVRTDRHPSDGAMGAADYSAATADFHFGSCRSAGLRLRISPSSST